MECIQRTLNTESKNDSEYASLDLVSNIINYNKARTNELIDRVNKMIKDTLISKY